MLKFTSVEYLYIEIANMHGLDKETYKQRIDWVKSNIDSLEELKSEAEEPSCYEAAVIALRDVQEGKPTGAVVRLDAVSSGPQILSVLTNCITGCKATGAINKEGEVRPVAYMEIFETMKSILGDNDVQIAYADIKKAVMQSVYGGKKFAKDSFTPRQHRAFTDACLTVATGAFSLLKVFIDAWNPNATSHSWTLPDGHVAYVPVINTETVDIETEIGPVSAIITEQGTKEYSVSLAANITQSVDAYLVRSVIRHCSYDVKETKEKLELVNKLLEESVKPEGSNLWDITMCPSTMNEWQLRKTKERLELLLSYKPFDVITVHDSYACSPLHAQKLREYYNLCLADLANDPEQGEGNALLDSILSELSGVQEEIEVFPLLNKDLIVSNNYSIN